MNQVVALLSLVVALGLAGPANGEDDGHDHGDHAGHDHGEDGHGEDGHDDGEPSVAEEDHGEIVKLDAATLREFDIEVATAAPGTIDKYITLSGEVRANADRLAHIVPRYAGVVTEVRVNIGDRVGKGETLAVVESDESLAPFEVTTLIAGTVIEKHVTLGEAVARDREVFVIADLATVWVDLTVYQRDLDQVRVGLPVRIFVGHGASYSSGKIGYVTPVVDEATRTATARVVLPNEDGRWRPGMFVRGKVLAGRDAVGVAVPPTAFQSYEGRTVVFVEEGGGFAPRPVRVGLAGEGAVEILDGLAPGERYVSRGGFTMKAELGRESLGHTGHAH